MNRINDYLSNWFSDVPRERGDEPVSADSDTALEMFPASAGMNRDIDNVQGGGEHVPRERGDEPVLDCAVYSIAPCSPRARG